MKIVREVIERDTVPDTDIQDLSDDVARIVAGSGVTEGTVLVFTPGSTAAVTTLEFESGAIADLRRAIDRLAPTGAHYDHDARWGDGNGYSHVRSALLGPSVSLPATGARLNTARSACHGTRFSLSSSLMPSAIGCSNPL